MGVQLGQSAALYCRVSSADQTCSRQELDLRAFAKKAGYKVVGVWKETASGAKNDRAERKKELALAQARSIDVILVTELTRWGRSMLDLFHTLQDLQVWGVSLVDAMLFDGRVDEWQEETRWRCRIKTCNGSAHFC